MASLPSSPPWHRLAVAGLVVLFAAAPSGHAEAQPPPPSRTAPNALLMELTKAEEKMKSASGVQEISPAAQTLAELRSVVGDYAGALAAMRTLVVNRPPPRPVDAASVKEILEGYDAIPAIEGIVEAARHRQVVILNEAHHISRHRAFAQMLAARLRAIGFEYLACETFSVHIEDLSARGYVTTRDGYYTREPLFADFIRQSLKLGYIPVRYEMETHSASQTGPADSINDRETQQAANLVKRIFEQNPKARVFIYVGYSHLKKVEQTRTSQSGRTVLWMAGRLKAATGIDPLTIDQVAMTDPDPGTLQAAVLASVFSSAQPETGAVLMHRSGAQPGYLVLGSYKGDAEMQVFHRPAKCVNGRPDWLAMGGYRKPQPIPADLLPKSGRRLVKAFVEGENEPAIAMDQIVVEAGKEPTPVFMLPPGRFKYVYEE